MLKASSYQVFLIIFIPLILSVNISDFWISTMFNILGYGMLFAWFLLVGRSLNEQLPDDEKRNDTFFIINCFYLIAFMSLSSILNSDKESEMPAFVLLLAVYFVFAFFYVVSFTAQSFLSIQELKSKKSTHFNSQMVFLYFFIFIVGIWFIQPRLNEYFKE